ncbi:hypothetical protein LTR62_000514 [Meristemomyces frigidus]|uniref:Cytochrome b561 domain-containing protein n=1 Tax=Meristemomyces frigidus TaxID=1508187 RepID=A0AAN7TD11_9PEZI|nr:hypothetical protein LTR62_000514 [Meristemomyces frigidus]
MRLPRILSTTAVAASYITSAHALYPQDFSAKGAYFVTDTAAGDQYVVGINAVHNGDLYFHMSAPYKNSWVGVGIGEEMAGAFMLISYKSANGTGVTTSPRMGTGHNEPELLDVNVEKIWTDEYAPNSNQAKAGGIFISHAVCRGCANYSSLSYTNKAQPFIFAMGPEEAMTSDSLEAPLRRHSYYGKFTMDMTVATTPLDFYEGADYGRVPGPNQNGTDAVINDNTFVSLGTSHGFDKHKDSDPYPIAHAVIMGLAFFVVFPAGSLLLRWLHSVTVHWIIQLIGVLMIAVGFACGVAVSLEYNHSKRFTSGHQILGLLILAGVLVQLGLGLAHHMIFKRTKQRTTFAKTHMVLGPLITILAIINGGLGLNFANENFARIPYAVAILVLGIAFIFARTWLHLFLRHQQYQPDEEVLEQYHSRRANAYDSESTNSPHSAASSSKRFDYSPSKLAEAGVAPAYEEVEVPEAYPDPKTPASIRDRHFTYGLSSPVTVAPPTPRWPISPTARPAGLERSYSAASRGSEEDEFIGQDHPMWKNSR